jgi:hypothetical protein
VTRPLRWTVPVGLAAAVLAAALGAERLRGWSRALPGMLVTEEIVAHLSDELPRDAVLAERAEDPVREGRLEPGDRLRAGGHRPSLVLPPPARVRFRLDAPPDAVLRFAVGVDGARDRDPSLGGVRFSVAVNGRERWSRVVNPAARKDDRRWFDETIALGTAGPTEVVLATTAEDPSRRLAGTPGFGQVRLVRTVSRPRIPAAAGPNLLVLLVDTLRADRLGIGGAVPSPSPTLDALAAGGRVFEQAVAQSSWTLPSVATLLTGLHPRSHGALGSAAGDRGARWGFLSDRVTTWPEAAGQAGITTFGVSTNPLVSRGSNLAQGFEGFVELPGIRRRGRGRTRRPSTRSSSPGCVRTAGTASRPGSTTWSRTTRTRRRPTCGRRRPRASVPRSPRDGSATSRAGSGRRTRRRRLRRSSTT